MKPLLSLRILSWFSTKTRLEVSNTSRFQKKMWKCLKTASLRYFIRFSYYKTFPEKGFFELNNNFCKKFIFFFSANYFLEDCIWIFLTFFQEKHFYMRMFWIFYFCFGDKWFFSKLRNLFSKIKIPWFFNHEFDLQKNLFFFFLIFLKSNL